MKRRLAKKARELGYATGEIGYTTGEIREGKTIHLHCIRRYSLNNLNDPSLLINENDREFFQTLREQSQQGARLYPRGLRR